MHLLDKYNYLRYYVLFYVALVSNNMHLLLILTLGQ